MAAGRATTACCHAWFRALHTRALKKLRDHRYYYFGSSGGSSSPSTASWPVLIAALLFAATATFFPRAVAFFLPLVASTSAFCATAYLSASSYDPDRGAAKEVVLVRGEGVPAVAGTLQVYADVNASAYGGGDRMSSTAGFQVGCFLRKSAKRGIDDEDGEEVVFAGRLLVPAPTAGTGLLEEELASLEVDRMAEGVWDSYFGRWSTWNHYASDDGCDD